MKAIEKLINLSNKLDLQGNYKESAQIDSLCEFLIKSAKTNKISKKEILKRASLIKLDKKNSIIFKEAILGDFFSGLGQIGKNLVTAPFKPFANIAVYKKLNNQLNFLIENLTKLHSEVNNTEDEQRIIEIRKNLVNEIDRSKLYFSEIAANNKNDKNIWTLAAMTSESLMLWEEKQKKFELPQAINDLRNVLLKIKQGTYQAEIAARQRSQYENHPNVTEMHYYNEKPKRRLGHLPPDEVYHQLKDKIRDRDLFEEFNKNGNAFTKMINNIIAPGTGFKKSLEIMKDYNAAMGIKATEAQVVERVRKIRAENGIF